MNDFVYADASLDATGTSLRDVIYITYQELVDLFGEPTDDGDGYKIDARWKLYTPDGIATIYNYKDGPNYGESETAVEDIREWHIGGLDEKVVQHVRDAIKGD